MATATTYANKTCAEIGISFAMTISTYFVTFHFSFTSSLHYDNSAEPIHKKRQKLFFLSAFCGVKENHKKYINVCMYYRYRIAYISFQLAFDSIRAGNSHEQHHRMSANTLLVARHETSVCVCVRLNEHWSTQYTIRHTSHCQWTLMKIGDSMYSSNNMTWQ